jgi:hypothetical protein
MGGIIPKYVTEAVKNVEAHLAETGMKLVEEGR